MNEPGTYASPCMDQWLAACPSSQQLNYAETANTHKTLPHLILSPANKESDAKHGATTYQYTIAYQLL